MKKSMLACALLLAYATTYADDTQSTSTTNAASPTTPTTTPATSTSGSNTTPATSTTPAEAPPGETLPNPDTIDCNYHISAKSKVSNELVKIWTEKAVVQSFDYNSNNIDYKLQNLKTCFTDIGWVGYTTALDQSGNLAAIRAQKLNVSSQVDSPATVSVIKENQWKVKLPIEVVYQNQQDKITQLLNIEVIVARKVSGDLGIQQIIASPRKG